MLASLVLIYALMAFMFKVLYLVGAAIVIWITVVGILLTAILSMIEGFLEKDPTKWRLKIITMYFILFL